MLILTANAIDVIEALTGEDRGLRVFVEPHGAKLHAAITEAPRPDDHVIDAEGVRVFVDAEAERRLHGKVLEATVHERLVRFTVIDRGRPRVRARRGPKPQLARWIEAGTWLRSSSAQ
jgi:Fe-S cluster assembly iron-binding protein IscA